MPEALQGVTEGQKRYVRRKNRYKIVRCVLQGVLAAVLLTWAVKAVFFPAQYDAASSPVTTEMDGTQTGFVAVSYAGLTTLERTSLVYRGDYEEQMDALAMNGFHTLTHEQVLDGMRQGGAFPARSMTLLFEDGLSDTMPLAQPAMERCGFLGIAAAYAEHLAEVGTRYLGASDIRRLNASSWWEVGCSGYRLSFINAFDRWGNPFGPLNMSEYLDVRRYMRRDYNHYLMDYLRDEDRMRIETPEIMRARIAADYESMRAAFTQAIDAVPAAYILMHANTGMFATHPDVSAENARRLTDLFALNYNRMGSCLNTSDASVYDLTRMQVQPYWSVNCMLMHIADDTGESMRFVSGDAQDRWDTTLGAAQFKGERIILTSLPRATGRMLLRQVRPADVTADVTLTGNVYGRQALYFRSDSRLSRGIAVAVERNVLLVEEIAEEGTKELFRLNLTDFDGGPTQSEEENELEGLLAYNKAILTWDEDAARREEAAAEFARLSRLRARTIAEGAAPYIPDIDVADRGNRRLTVTLRGGLLDVSVDGRVAVAALPVSVTQPGQVLLESSPLLHENLEYSQRNVYEDVYDGVFTNLTLTDGVGSVLYQTPQDTTDAALRGIRRVVDVIVNFVLEHF